MKKKKKITHTRGSTDYFLLTLIHCQKKWENYKRVEANFGFTLSEINIYKMMLIDRLTKLNCTSLCFSVCHRSILLSRSIPFSWQL
uniref:Uncharacterized protein n=1 Tax=Glossina morsitans morsitans TaxID=37546 RepID=A0ABK9NG30_GLOMM